MSMNFTDMNKSIKEFNRKMLDERSFPFLITFYLSQLLVLQQEKLCFYFLLLIYFSNPPRFYKLVF